MQTRQSDEIWVRQTILSKHDILELYNECISSLQEEIQLKIENVYDPEAFILAGFLPELRNYNLLLDYLSGMSLNELIYWHNRYDAFMITNLRKHSSWWFRKISYYKRKGIEEAESLGLLLYAPELLYRSNRPITDMSIYRGPGNRTLYRNEVVNEAILLDGNKWKVIPVTRYSSGMSRGLYHPNGGSYCGTFYYHEPQSGTLLAYKTSLVAFNKLDALSKLDPSRNIIDFKKTNPLLMEHYEGKLPKDLRLTPMEYSRIKHKNYGGTISQNRYYVGKLLELYAAEDEFDQEICLLAKDQDIDLIILTHMVGSHQIVTEVLDVRDRNDSFNSLIYLLD